MTLSNKNNNRREHWIFVYPVQLNRSTFGGEINSSIRYIIKVIIRDYNINYKKIVFGVPKNKLYFLPKYFSISPAL